MVLGHEQHLVGADGVAIENLTARNYTLNGFYWTGVSGFRGSYLTAYNNGDYGIYAFGATDGVLEHSYGSGSPDSSFYVGQCAPCRVVLDDDIGAYSGLGYSGTNSSGEMYVLRSRFEHNRTGISTTTFDIELHPPGRETVIIANGRTPDVLTRLLAGDDLGTLLTSQGRSLSPLKRWIGFPSAAMRKAMSNQGNWAEICRHGRNASSNCHALFRRVCGTRARCSAESSGVD